MTNDNCKFNLKSMIILLSFFLMIVFFATPRVHAASFKYSEFDWDSFAEENKNYWGRYCADDDKGCEQSIIDTQEQFYTRLYRILASFEDNGLLIDDLPIIMTVYYGYMPDRFNDYSYLGEYFYEKDGSTNFLDIIVSRIMDKFFADKLINEDDTIKVLVNAMTGYERVCYGKNEARAVCNDEPSSEDARLAPASGCYACSSNAQSYGCKYYMQGQELAPACGNSLASESACIQDGTSCSVPGGSSSSSSQSDQRKAPTAGCYACAHDVGYSCEFHKKNDLMSSKCGGGIVDESVCLQPTPETCTLPEGLSFSDNNGCKDVSYVCDEGFLDETGETPMCSVALYKENLAFYDVLMDRFGYPEFMGIKQSKPDLCAEEAAKAGYVSYESNTSEQKQVMETMYWTFLKYSYFFDKRDYFQYKYSKILKATGHANMMELTDAERAQYDDEIKHVRQSIINGIQAVLRMYDRNPVDPEKLDYLTPSNGEVNQYVGGAATMWWPIGSPQTTTVDGKLFASDLPEVTVVTSPYGPRDLKGGFHYGLDIGASGDVVGSRSVIAAEDGTVTEAVDGCPDASNVNDTCGSGYGNHVYISHGNGLVTIYGHLQQGSVLVSTGDTVQKGQVLGRMGSSGSSTAAHLHFQVNLNGMAVDPQNGYVNIGNPRPGAISGSGEGSYGAWLTFLEGTGNIVGDSYEVYLDGGGVATVGVGVTLVHNYNSFVRFGFDPNTCGTMSTSYSGCKGTLIPISLVDQVYAVEGDTRRDEARKYLAQNGISLTANYQLDALTSAVYNAGAGILYDGAGFADAYRKYGATPALCQNWWDNKYIRPCNCVVGLQKRRRKECDLFVYGDYSSTDKWQNSYADRNNIISYSTCCAQTPSDRTC